MKEPKEGYKYQDDTRPKIEYDSGSEHYLRAEDEFWHIFNTGWLKGFKNRTGISCCSTRESQRHTPTQTEKADWKNKMIIWKLDKYSHDDIYTCDLATMFLSAVPGQSMMPSKRDSSSVSVLLGCSANGRHKLDPVVLVRQSAGEFEVGGGYNGYNDVVLDAQLDDLTSSTFENWLSEFDSSIGRKVFLFVDQPLWDMVSKGWGILKPPLRHVKIVPVPRWLSASLPMNQMIIKEFKAFFHAHVLENTKARMHYMPKQPMNDVFVGSYNRRYNLQDPTCASSLNAITPSSQEPLDKAFRVCPINSPLSQPRPIYEAWSQVSSLVIVQSFQTFFKEAEFPEMQRMADIITLRDKSIGQTRLKYVLENVLSLPEEEWISRYYQNHDLDIGPSSFIRERILVMQHHQDFRHCFGNIDFGFVRFGGKRPVGGRIKRFENVLQKELAHSKMLLDQYNFGSNVLPKLLFLGRCTLGSYEL
ncbi:hypothetical protein BGZ46_002423 [Entomortierella lignicola]|nr:hypothetical protein BGZ46_002423 [Entomortierella lignicola]